MTYVIDASVALRWIIKDEKDDASDAVRRAIVDHPDLFIVPELFLYETYTVLAKAVVSYSAAYENCITSLLRQGVARYPMTPNISLLAARYISAGLKGYDACYAAVAEEMGGLWLTYDGKAHRAIADLGVSADIGAGLPEGFPALA